MTEDQTFYDTAVQKGYRHGAIGNETLTPDDPKNLWDPNWRGPNPTPDPDRDELIVPTFEGHPVPPAARFLWVASRKAGCAPPWYVRVSPRICFTYSMRMIALALDPHARIVTTPDGRHPAPLLNPGSNMDIEFNFQDNPGYRGPSTKTLWLPDDVQRSK